MRTVFVEERLVVNYLMLNSFEDDTLDALSEFERRDGFGNGNGRRIHRRNNSNSSVAG
jgi:hypothetical protein